MRSGGKWRFAGSSNRCATRAQFRRWSRSFAGESRSRRHRFGETAMKILVVDDHPLIVRALEESLPHVDPRFDVVASSNREQTLTALARYPDCALALLDLTLPGAHGLDLLAELRRDYPCLPIVVLSATHDRATVGSALAAGARGYIAKTSTPEELLDAVRTVLGGGRSVTTDFSPLAPSIGGLSGQTLGLTHRQADVLRLLIQGKPNKLIGNASAETPFS